MTEQLKRLSELDVAVLVGGLGTRLRSVIGDRPKVLAEIDGVPFLTILLDQLVAAGCRSAVLCTGYRADQISEVFGSHYGPLHLKYSQEYQSLGTAGALRLAIPELKSDPVLVMNGDSYFAIDLTVFLRWHCERRANASMALSRVTLNDRYGLVKFGWDARVLEFAEKKPGAGGWINAGIYFLGREVLESIPEGRGCSLERDIFPLWIGREFYGYSSAAPFIDIGTPEDFAAAQKFFRTMVACVAGPK